MARMWIRTWGCAALLALAACQTLIDIDTLNGRYDALVNERTRLAPGASAEGVEGKFGALAADAEAAADRTPVATQKAGFFRIAALSLWQAGPSRREQVSQVATRGIEVCQQLTPPDLAAPGDCLQIRMTPVRASYDEVLMRYRELESRAPLDDAQKQQVKDWFELLEGRFREAKDVRQLFDGDRIDRGQLMALDEDRFQIYCLAKLELNLLPLRELQPFAARRDAMRDDLPQAFRSRSC
jgi:hypothetical protein